MTEPHESVEEYWAEADAAVRQLDEASEPMAFWDAIMEDTEATAEQKLYWLRECCQDQYENRRYAERERDEARFIADKKHELIEKLRAEIAEQRDEIAWLRSLIAGPEVEATPPAWMDGQKS